MLEFLKKSKYEFVYSDENYFGVGPEIAMVEESVPVKNGYFYLDLYPNAYLRAGVVFSPIFFLFLLTQETAC